MLPVEPRHFHVANHQVKSLPRSAVQSFASVHQDFHAHALVLEHVGDQAGHGRLVFYNEHARAISAFVFGRRVFRSDYDFLSFGEQFLPAGEW